MADDLKALAGIPRPSASPRSPVPSPPAKRQPYKRTRDLPDLFYCHCCGHRFPSDGPISRLHPLPSQWRVVLLCRPCLGTITSGSSCSYCFSPLPPPSTENSLGLRTCCRCRCRVHLSCVPHQRGYVSIAELDPESFTCIDCCAVPKYKARTQNSSPGSRFLSEFKLEDLVRDAEKKAEAAARAKDKALKKAIAAKCAVEKARNVLDAVYVSKEPQESAKERVLNDEELALQLHLAMNGSQRLSRNLRPRNSNVLFDSKRRRCGNGSDLGVHHGACAKVELCTEDNQFFETMENSMLDQGKREKEEVAESHENGTSLSTVKVEEEICSDMASGDEKPVRTNSVAISLVDSRAVREGSAESQQKKNHDVSDRYLKKYSKRHSKGVVERNENQLITCRQISCFESSRTYSDGQSHTIPVHSSLYSNFSGCKS